MEADLDAIAPEAILVSVDGSNRFGGSWYQSSVVIGDYETYITRDIVARVDSAYRTIPHRENRGVWGVSMGGFGALHLALNYPEVFSVVLGTAGPYDFNEDGWRQTMRDGIPSALAADWDSYRDLRWTVGIRRFLSWAAAAIPDPDNPPFFVDVSFIEVDGEIQESTPGA